MVEARSITGRGLACLRRFRSRIFVRRVQISRCLDLQEVLRELRQTNPAAADAAAIILGRLETAAATCCCAGGPCLEKNSAAQHEQPSDHADTAAGAGRCMVSREDPNGAVSLRRYLRLGSELFALWEGRRFRATKRERVAH